eukprot:TRINITY_DN24367_c0_g1_i1.p1 TRINITY_DN24367_c0_g1~~TRINITY_DN24367_c0_g1_i1.p1  ORF type:complete len:374 (-),score=42.30 TRINITY_DN24367_c0_g1_i1:185-1306(-)
MHGRPRPLKNEPVDPAKKEKEKQKLELYEKLLSEILKRREGGRYDEETLEKISTLLSINPDVYTLWNYRRETFQHLIQKENTKQDTDDQEQQQQEDNGHDNLEQLKLKLSEIELKVSFAALMTNPKSYSAWHHRKWIVQQGACSLQKELHKVTEFLKKDGRNFHGWNYRLFLVKLMNRSAEEELDYSSQKINESFSNYSAWHYRTKLLPDAHTARGYKTLEELMKDTPIEQTLLSEENKTIPVVALEEEFEYVKQAMFTDPEDQSGWLYHRWLLSQAVKGIKSVTYLQQILQKQYNTCQELLEVEPDSKWPLITSAWIQEIQMEFEKEEDKKAVLKSSIKEIYEKLGRMDILRLGFYQDASQHKASVIQRVLK